MVRDGGVRQLLRLVKVKYEEEQGRVLCLEVVRTLALLTRGSSRARVGAPGACWQETQFNGEWCLIPSR